MLNYIYGSLIERNKNSIVLATNNVGFEIFTLKSDNFILLEEYKLLIYDFMNSENEIILYGFKRQIDYKIFKKLIRIPGIGCKTAVSILNNISSEELISYVKNDNFVALNNAIGSKANSVILSLKKNLNLSYDLFKYENVYEALRNLGYKKEQIQGAFLKIDNDLNEEEALKQALKLINYV